MLPILLSWFIAAQAVDVSTTAIALARGYHEVNPIVGHSIGRLVVTKAAVTVGVVLLARRADRSHPRLTRAALVIVAAVTTIAAIHNARVVARGP